MFSIKKPPLLKMKKYSRLALEMIHIQDPQFGHRLNAEVSKLVNRITSSEISTQADVASSVEVKHLQQIIFDRMGMKVTLITNSLLAAILPYYSNKHHVFLSDMLKGNISIKEQNKALEKVIGKSGFVDTKSARLGGLFSEYNHKVFMNFMDLIKKYKCSSSEITGIMLHELGHGFHACEYSDRMESSNLIIQDVCKRIATEKEKVKSDYVYQEISKIDKTVTEKEIDNLVNGSRIIAGYTWYKVVVEATRQAGKSQMTQSKYDETAFEQVADNFATRFGYGRELIAGLEKITDHGGVEKSSMSGKINTLLEMTVSVMIVAAIISSAGAGFIAAPVFYSLILGLILYGSGENVRDYTYDELKIRYKRIRNEFINMLKQANLSKAETQMLVDNISFADSMINSTFQHESVYRKISNFLLPYNRSAKNSIQEQQFLEEMIHNDLFLKSAQLQIV